MNDNRKAKLTACAETWIIILVIWMISAFVVRRLGFSLLILIVSAGFSAIAILAWRNQNQFYVIASWCVRYRWVLAFLVFSACVILHLHGSSIGIYDEVFHAQINQEETTLFGIPRWIRGDEFGVQTPIFFSQQANDYQLYSNQMSISKTNMILDYYSPVRNITAIGKPLSWGYLFFGNEVGLSWYWCGIEILLFMTSFEMCLIITRGSKMASGIGATMIALSPEIQWWVLPHMPTVTLYAMGLFCVGYYFFTAKSLSCKWFFAVMSTIAATGFALSIFPSYQIPFAYIVLAMLAVCLYRDREHISFNKSEWYRIAIPAVVTIGVLFWFVYVSLDDIDLLLNTIYPGRRVSVGGNRNIDVLFPDICSLFLPYKDIHYANNCEVSTYIHFAPFFVLIFPRVLSYLKRSKSPDCNIGIALFIVLLLEAEFMVIRLPEGLAKISLLSYCNRMDGIYDWTAAIFSIWGISVLLRYPEVLKKWEKIIYPIIYAFVILLGTKDGVKEYLQCQSCGINTGNILLVFVVVIFTIILLLATFQKRRLLTAGIVLLMMFCGGTVNPIERGTGAIYNHPISAEITKIAEEEPDSRWLCTDCAFYFSNFVMANGAKVINATNFYPDIEKWAIIDPDSKYDNISNRYANLTATIVEENNKAELLLADYVKISLNPASLKEMEIQYLFSKTNYSELLARADIESEQIAEQDGFAVYKLYY